MSPSSKKYKTKRANRGVTRAKIVRRTARLVLLGGLLAVVVVPVSWERLPDFGLVFVPPSDAPPGPPGPGIEPTDEPPGPRIITPQNPAPLSTSGEYAYVDNFEGKPPYHSTCEPVPFVIRTTAAPANGDELIFEALQQVADANGLSFEFGGYTTSPYDFNARTERYSWEAERIPLWIGWASVDEVPDLGPRSGTEPYAIGLGGPGILTRRDDGQIEVIGGGVVLRAGEQIAHEFGTGSNSGNVLLHEIGHALGLDHVDSLPEQMYPSSQDENPDGYGLGDVRGLQGMTKACG